MNQMSEQEKKKISGYLGIAQRAGKIVAGNNMVKEALEKKRVKLLVIADNASNEVKSSLSLLAQKNGICVISWPTKDELGLIVGKSRRGALGVLDDGFAQAIKKVKGIINA